jgi:hypothetical protein
MDLPQKRPFKRPRDVFSYTSFPFGCISILTAGIVMPRDEELPIIRAFYSEAQLGPAAEMGLR